MITICVLINKIKNTKLNYMTTNKIKKKRQLTDNISS